MTGCVDYQGGQALGSTGSEEGFSNTDVHSAHDKINIENPQRGNA